MIIPLEKLTAKGVYHNRGYSHQIAEYQVCTTEDNPPVLEVTIFPSIFSTEEVKVSYEVYMSSEPEPYNGPLPEKAIGFEQDSEPDNEAGDLFAVYAKFATLEDAYAYAIAWNPWR